MTFKEQDNGRGPQSSRTLGVLAEEAAALHLRSLGYRLVMANFKVQIGRNLNGAEVTGEIDIIALDGDTICFVEVKARSSDEFAGPLSAVDLRKQRQIIRTARVYRRIFGLNDMKSRYDVVAVVSRKSGKPTVELIKGYWDEAKFKKRFWSDDDWR